MTTSYTILICTRNRAEMLARALTSHLDLVIPPGVMRDILVVDNGSSDNTAEIVESFRRQASFPVTYLREDRAGHSMALNAGCRAASGDFICFTDDDAFPHPNWLVSYHTCFAENGADWVFGPVIPKWEGCHAPVWYGPETAALVACLDYGNELFVVTDDTKHFAGVNHGCKRQCILDLGLYREDLGILPGKKGVAGNDDDLFRRALLAGLRVVYNPGARVDHLIPAARTARRHHRRIVKLVAGNQYRSYCETPPPYPTLWRIPRFWFKKPFLPARAWLLTWFHGTSSARFYHELQLLRSCTLLWHAFTGPAHARFIRRDSGS